MKQKMDERPSTRRAFLKGAIAASGGVAIAAVSSAPVLADVPEDDASTTQSAGYQLSEHVLQYYRTLKR